MVAERGGEQRHEAGARTHVEHAGGCCGQEPVERTGPGGALGGIGVAVAATAVVGSGVDVHAAELNPAVPLANVHDVVRTAHDRSATGGSRSDAGADPQPWASG